MDYRTLQYTMMAVFITVIIGFLITSIFLIREIVRTKASDSTTKVFRIEVAILAVCLAGFVGSLVSLFILF